MGNLGELSHSKQCHCTFYRARGALQLPGHNSVHMTPRSSVSTYILAHLVTLGGFCQWQSHGASALLQGTEKWPGNTALCCLAIPSLSCHCHLLTPSLPWFGSIFFLSHSDLEKKTTFGSQPSALRFKNQYKSWRKQHSLRGHTLKLLVQQKFCLRRPGMGLEEGTEGVCAINLPDCNLQSTFLISTAGKQHVTD